MRGLLAWWTFEPLFDDDMELGGVLRNWACWVSDQGNTWHGPDPEEWTRRHRRRQANRFWLREERSRCNCAAMTLRRVSVPASLAHDILAWSFAEDIVKAAMR